MCAFRYISNRVIKIGANGLKIFCYGFHAIFPGKRFRIPEHSGPLIPKGGSHRVPRIVWQTNFTDRVALPVYLNYLFNRLMAPHHVFRFVSTEGRRRYIGETYSAATLRRFDRLTIGAAQADMWRVLVLLTEGGVYMDIDANLTWPLHRTLGAEEVALLFIIDRNKKLSNFFLASEPGRPELREVAEAIERNIDLAASNNVYELTGPAVFQRVLADRELPTVPFRMACEQGNFTNEYFQYIDMPGGKWIRAQQHQTPLADGPARRDSPPPDVVQP